MHRTFRVSLPRSVNLLAFSSIGDECCQIGVFFLLLSWLSISFELKTQKNQFIIELVSACPATSYSHRDVSPNYHQRASLASVFGTRPAISGGSRRRLRSLSTHVHRTFRASLTCLLDLLASPQSEMPDVILVSVFLYSRPSISSEMNAQKNQFKTELVFACPATSYSHRDVSPNYHRR